jgi:ferredoxin-fold anticodon binding domain-containing protein
MSEESKRFDDKVWRGGRKEQTGLAGLEKNTRKQKLKIDAVRVKAAGTKRKYRKEKRKHLHCQVGTLWAVQLGKDVAAAKSAVRGSRSSTLGV